MSARLAVFCSGGGSNFQAILDYLAQQAVPRRVEVALMATDRPGAGAIERARRHDVPYAIMDVGLRTTGQLALLESHGIDYIALAGYLRFVPNDVTETFRGRIVNVHPALLPSFGGPGMYGHHVHAAVRASGVGVTGVTVHFVDAAYDHGPIIAQWPVPVLADDSVEAIARRVLDVEHALYPRVVHGVTTGRITLGDDGRVHGRPAVNRPYFVLQGAPGDLGAMFEHSQT